MMQPYNDLYSEMADIDPSSITLSETDVEKVLRQYPELLAVFEADEELTKTANNHECLGHNTVIPTFVEEADEQHVLDDDDFPVLSFDTNTSFLEPVTTTQSALMATATTNYLPGLGNISASTYSNKLHPALSIKCASPSIFLNVSAFTADRPASVRDQTVPSPSSILTPHAYGAEIPNGGGLPLYEASSFPFGTVDVSNLTTTAPALPLGVQSEINWSVVDDQETDSQSSFDGEVATSSSCARPTIGTKRGRPQASSYEPQNGPTSEKKERRRKQNREAATRCRNKRRKEFDDLKTNYDHVMAENQSLKDEMKALKMQLNNYQKVFQVHQQHCKLQITKSVQ